MDTNELIFSMWKSVLDMWEAMIVLGALNFGMQLVVFITLIDKRRGG